MTKVQSTFGLILILACAWACGEESENSEYLSSDGTHSEKASDRDSSDNVSSQSSMHDKRLQSVTLVRSLTSIDYVEEYETTITSQGDVYVRRSGGGAAPGVFRGRLNEVDIGMLTELLASARDSLGAVAVLEEGSDAGFAQLVARYADGSHAIVEHRAFDMPSRKNMPDWFWVTVRVIEGLSLRAQVFVGGEESIIPIIVMDKESVTK